MSGDTGARFAASSVGALLAETITLPTDVAKVRLQVQNTAKVEGAASSAPKYAGFVDCLVKTARDEGVTALWKGLAPALVRQVCYTAMGMVLYEPVRDFYKGAIGGSCDAPSYAVRLAAGGTSGAIAISVFNPAEVVKTKVQTNVSESLSMGSVVKRVWQMDGIRGFWAGLQPNVARTFLVNAAELGTYDEAKARVQPYFGSGLVSHVAASGIAGFTSACVSTPVDVIKTRLMNSAGSEKQYSGVVNAGARILSEEGPFALYKGFLPICVRKLIWCGIFFVTYEQARAALNK
jgi:hypothetical protein